MHFWLMHALFDGQSLLITHSGRQLGADPIIPGKQSHSALLFTALQVLYGPHGGGLQGSLSDNTHIMACVKHYAVYGAVEAGREYNNVDVSRVALWNKYLPPYKAAIDAGAMSIMISFSSFDGMKMSAQKWMIDRR